MDTRRSYNDTSTLIQHHEVESTLLQRCINVMVYDSSRLRIRTSWFRSVEGLVGLVPMRVQKG